MGMRAHVRTKSIVEHNYDGRFNLLMEELCNLLEERGCDTSYSSDEDGNVKYEWELKTDEVKDVIKSLREETPDTKLINDYTAEKIAEILEGWVATVEQHPENYNTTTYIHIDWF